MVEIPTNMVHSISSSKSLTLAPRRNVGIVEGETRERLEVELGPVVDDEAALLRVLRRVVRPLGKVPRRRRTWTHLRFQFVSLSLHFSLMETRGASSIEPSAERMSR